MPYQIAILIETINSYGRGIVRGIYRYINDQPANTLFFEERTLDSPPPAWLNRWRGNGIIVRDRTGECCRTALKTGAKIVDLSERRHPGVPTVFSDYVGCSNMAAKHLMERGFAHFGYVGIRDRPFSERRRDAFVRAVGEAAVFDLHGDERTFPSWGSDYTALIDWLKKLPKPIGIMACVDLVGIGVLQACRLAGIGVPDEVAIIGVNNDELQCVMSNPPLSSVMQNPERIGFEACDLLFRLMAGESASLEPSFIEPLGVIARQSTDIFVVPDMLVVRSIRLIRENACRGMEIDEVAARLGVSRRTLERRFVKALNRTPHDEIIAVRISRARELLSETLLPLRVVAKRIGLKNLPYFTKLFIKETGIRPLEYRRKTRLDQLVNRKIDD